MSDEIENLSRMYQLSQMDPNLKAADDDLPLLLRLHSWDALMELLDTHWPADIFPTREDDPKRNSAARIISLLRWVDRDRAALARVEAVCASITRDRAARRVEGVADLAVKDAIDTFAEAVRDAMLDAAAPFHAQHGQSIQITYTNPDSSEFGAKAAIKAFIARSRFRR